MNTRLRTLAAPAVLVTAAALLLAGCQSSGSTGATGGTRPTAAPSAAAGRNGGGDGAPFGGGGVSGQIAAVNGTVAQIRGQDGQTSVSWSGSTTFERTTAAALSDLKVGDCVNASSFDLSAAQDGSSRPTPSTGGPVRTVAITAASSDGTCTGGFGGGFGGFGGQRPTGAPTGAPGQGENRRGSGQRPTGAPGGNRAFGGFTSGKVTAIDGSTITVDAVQLSAQAGGGATPTTAPKQITVDSSTTYTTTTTSDAQAVQVGLCAVARGKADDSGAVAATAITVSDPTNGSCSTGFGGFRGRGGGQGGGAGAGQGGGQGSTQGGSNA